MIKVTAKDAVASEIKAGDFFVPFRVQLEHEVRAGIDGDPVPKIAELPSPLWVALVDGAEFPESDQGNEVSLLIFEQE